MNIERTAFLRVYILHTINNLHFFPFSISPRKLMLYGMLSQIITGCTAGWVPYYEMHMLFRLLASASCAQMNTAGQMICNKPY